MNIAGLRAAIGRALGRRASEGFRPAVYWHVECVRNGEVVWTDEGENLIVDTGLNDALDKWLKGSTYTAAFYIGLTDGTPTVAAGDTMSSHAGWVEVTDYDEAARQTLTLGSVSSKSVNNSSNKGVFTISATTTVGGAFLTTNNTKGGTTGTLISAKAFTGGDRSVVDNDVLNVTVTVTASSS